MTDQNLCNKRNDPDITGILLNCAVLLLGVSPFFTSIFGALILQIDPIGQTKKYLISQHTYSKLSMKFWWLPLTLSETLFICEAFRFLANMICMCTLTGILFIERISHLQNYAGYLASRRRKVVENYLIQYRYLEIILASSSEFVAPAVSILKFVAFLAFVTLNFITLKMSHAIPMPLFLIFPSMAVACGIAIHVLLRISIAVYENSRKVLDKWSLILARIRDKRYSRRRLRGFKETGIYAGFLHFNFYVCKKSTKSTFYDTILSYTISALMSIDARYILNTYLYAYIYM